MDKIQTINFLLFDAAKAEQMLFEAQEKNADNRSLYLGTAQEELYGVAPYLFSLKEKTEFLSWFFEQGWNNHWGVMLQTDAPFEEVFKHFRKFLMVKTEGGEQLYFRFYDPRVLRIFLPTCDRNQLSEFFGPIKSFITEDENPGNLLVFKLRNGELLTEKMPLSAIHKGSTAATIEKSEDNAQANDVVPNNTSNSWID